MKFLSQAFAFVLIMALLYLLCSFIAWSFNPNQWWELGRVLASGAALYVISELSKDDEDKVITGQ